jgi:hypothetical protein
MNIIITNNYSQFGNNTFKVDAVQPLSQKICMVALGGDIWGAN